MALPTAFVHNPPGYSSLMKRNKERPCIVLAGSSVRVNGCDSTSKGHCFCCPWHFYHHAQGLYLPNVLIIISLPLISAGIIFHYPEKGLIPIFFLPGLSQQMARDNRLFSLASFRQSKFASPTLSSHFLVIPNSSVKVFIRGSHLY